MSKPNPKDEAARPKAKHGPGLRFSRGKELKVWIVVFETGSKCYMEWPDAMKLVKCGQAELL